MQVKLVRRLLVTVWMVFILGAGYVSADNVATYDTNGQVGFVGKYPDKNSESADNNNNSPFYNGANQQNGKKVLPDTGDINMRKYLFLPMTMLAMGLGLMAFRSQTPRKITKRVK